MIAPRRLVSAAIVVAAGCGPRATPAPPATTTPASSEATTSAPSEAAAPPAPDEAANPWAPLENESEAEREARLDLRDLLGEHCDTYLTTADVKATCGRTIEILDSWEAGEITDEWPPACVRTARHDGYAYPLRLVVDNEYADPKGAVASRERAGARSIALGDAALVTTETYDDNVSRVVYVAVGRMLVMIEAIDRDATSVPCTEPQLVDLAKRVVSRLPR